MLIACDDATDHQERLRKVGAVEASPFAATDIQRSAIERDRNRRQAANVLASRLTSLDRRHDHATDLD
jgi:hypothetical protein